jgi:hypothetical protein
MPPVSRSFRDSAQNKYALAAWIRKTERADYWRTLRLARGTNPSADCDTDAAPDNRLCFRFQLRRHPETLNLR